MSASSHARVAPSGECLLGKGLGPGISGVVDWSGEICYVVTVLWMTSSIHLMEGIGQNGRRRVCFV